MQVSIRKLSLILCLSLLLHISLATPLRAQETEDTSNPQFTQISPANGTVVAATEVTITGQIEAKTLVEVVVGGIKARTDSKGRFTLKGVTLKTGKNTFTLMLRQTGQPPSEIPR